MIRKRVTLAVKLCQAAAMSCGWKASKPVFREPCVRTEPSRVSLHLVAVKPSDHTSYCVMLYYIISLYYIYMIWGFVLLDFITQKILQQEFDLWSLSLCNCLHSLLILIFPLAICSSAFTTCIINTENNFAWLCMS